MISDLWIVVPAYNEQATIKDTLDSLACQQFSEFSVVVVDNGSTDATPVIVEAFIAAHPFMRVDLVKETQKGTGAAADTGMRHAIKAGASRLARTDADCLATPEWVARISAGFDDGLELIVGQLIPRRDEGNSMPRQWLLRATLELAAASGKFRPDNRGPQFIGPYVMMPGSNMAITSEMYLRAGGFPRTRIEDLHEDRALFNVVRTLTNNYRRRRDVRVYWSCRRIQAWGIARTLAWYADHRYRPAVVDIR